MTVDLTTIYNLALDSIGARNRVSSPSEQSREAESCNLWFPAVRDQILAAARWPEATKMQRLAQLSVMDDDGEWEIGEAKSGYTYVYALPSDCLRPQYTMDYSPFDILHYDDEMRGLHTNTLAPVLIFTFRQEIISLWSSELKMAVVKALAANICMPLTGKPTRAKMLMQEANATVVAARETAANTPNEMIPETVPDWISMRGYSGSVPSTRFYYPLGSLLSAVNGVN